MAAHEWPGELSTDSRESQEAPPGQVSKAESYMPASMKLKGADPDAIAIYGDPEHEQDHRAMKEQRKSKRERTRLAVANLKTPCRNSEATRQGYERYLKD